MLGLLNNSQLFDYLILLQEAVLFISVFLFLFFGWSKYKLTKNIYENSFTKKLDDEHLMLSLFYVDIGIKKTCVCIMFTICIYIILYIMK